MGPKGWQTLLACCLVVVGCLLFFEAMLKFASH